MTIKNAFSAFDLDADEATIDTLRTDIAFALREFIERSRLGQVKIGKMLGLKQSVVSHIVRGDVEHLSVERLIRAMVKAGIPGFAEWGESAEDARAGAGFNIQRAASTPVIYTPQFQVSGDTWQGVLPENKSEPTSAITSRDH